MKAIMAPRLRMVIPMVLGFWLLGIGTPVSPCAGQSGAKPAEKDSQTQASPNADEQQILAEAFRSAQGNPQLVIKNMSDFLDRFPQTSQREIVLRTICSYGAAANAPEVVIRYGQMLLKIKPDEPKLLNLLIDALARQNDAASSILGIDYTSRLIKIAEAGRDKAALAGGSGESSDLWAERVADSYARRAEFNRSSGNLDSALHDYEQSYSANPTSHVAELLGDVAASKADSTRALDYYLTAFAFPDKSSDPARREEIRRKLSSVYVAQHHSEKGLGDRVLARYDELVPQIAKRLSAAPPQNNGVQDPFKYVLLRTDGTPLPLADYRGKILVVDFWATWCGPCRVAGQIVDQVAESFRTDSNITFLALNVDEDRSGVPAFFQEAGWKVPMAYAQGLNQLLSVQELPTFIIFDRSGEIVYRADGFVPNTFAAELTRNIKQTLRESAGSKQ